MGLLEPDDEQAIDTTFDPESKIRLFETQQREHDSGLGYVKKFLPVALVAIVAIVGVIYFMQPGIGSAVKPPKDVEDAVYEYMNSKEHRSVREITFYNCDGYYWVKILAEPRSAVASVDDPANQYRLTVKQQDGSVGIDTLPLPPKEHDVPCLWKRDNG